MIYASPLASSSSTQLSQRFFRNLTCSLVDRESFSLPSRRESKRDYLSVGKFQKKRLIRVLLTTRKGVAGRFGELIEGTKGNFRDRMEISGQLAVWRRPLLVAEAAASRARSQGLSPVERERERERIERGAE